MNLLIASSEFTCILFLLIMIFGSILDFKQANSTSKAFFYALISTVLFTLIDALSWCFENHVSLNGINLVLSAISYFGASVASFMFSIYVRSFISEKRPINYALPIIVGTLSSISIVYVIVTSLLGVLFRIDASGNFIATEFVIGSTIFNALSIFTCSLFILLNLKYFAKSEIVAFFLFMLLPLISMGIEAFIPEASFIYVAICITMMDIHLFIQSNTISKAKIEQKLMEEFLNQDTLTGLQNRRAFEQAIKRVKMNDNYCILFADLNKLKFTNDTLGHDAGDILIIQFANLFALEFGTDKVYRISGDEFVAILNKSKEEYEQTLLKFRDEIHNNNDIACCGGFYGKDSDAYLSFKNAEKDLNIEKAKYYSRIGIERRK